MYEEELRNLQNDLNQKDQKISQLEKEQKQLYKKYKSLKGKSKGNFGHLCCTFFNLEVDYVRGIELTIFYKGVILEIWKWSSKNSKTKLMIR